MPKRIRRFYRVSWRLGFTMQRWDWIWLLLVAAAAVAFSVWGLPYFTQLGHPLWSIPVYAFFLVIFLYGRTNRPPRENKLHGARKSPR